MKIQKIVRTKGDANPSSIAGTDYPITEKEYLGQVEYVIPQVGYITQILTTTNQLHNNCSDNWSHDCETFCRKRKEKN